MRNDFDDAMVFADVFAKLISAERGGPRAKVWGKPGVGVRVYVGNGGYFSVSRGGDLATASRGSTTFVPSGLYPAQRQAVQRARDAYHAAQRERLESDVRGALIGGVMETGWKLWPWFLIGGAVLGVVVLARRAVSILPKALMKIASGWGEAREYRNGVHYGVDFLAPIGTPLKSRFAGLVVIAHTEADNNAGKWIAVQHTDGSTWEYMHLSAVYVKVGDHVKAGQVIGLTGNTMDPVMSSDAHLHLTVRLTPAALRAYASRYGTPSGGFGSENERGTAVPAEVYFS